MCQVTPLVNTQGGGVEQLFCPQGIKVFAARHRPTKTCDIPFSFHMLHPPEFGEQCSKQFQLYQRRGLDLPLRGLQATMATAIEIFCMNQA